MFYFRAFLLCLPLLGNSGAVYAQETQVAFGGLKADTTLPVEVTADALDINQNSGSAEFQGNVIVGQGEMRLTAPRLLVIYKDGDVGGIERLEATGGVTLVSGPDAAEADRADYTIDSGVVIMTGDVLLTQGNNVLTSQKMTVNLTTGTANMVGRVKTILNPSGE